MVDAPGTPADRLAQSWMRRSGRATLELAAAGQTTPFACCRRAARLGHAHWLDRDSLQRCASALTVPQVAMIEMITDSDLPRTLDCLAHVDAITTTSKRWQIKLEHLIDREVWRIPHTVDAQQLAPQKTARSASRQAAGLGNRDFVLGVTGDIAPAKNEIELLGQIISGARESGLNIVLAPVGSFTESQLAPLRFPEVRLLPPAPIIAASTILDALAITTAVDASPVSILEAMACGVPVITPVLGHVPDIMVDGQTGLVCREHTAREYLAKITSLSHNAALAESIRCAARSWIVSERDESAALGRIDFADLYYHAARYYARRPAHEQISRRFLQSVLALRFPFTRGRP